MDPELFIKVADPKQLVENTFSASWDRLVFGAAKTFSKNRKKGVDIYLAL